MSSSSTELRSGRVESDSSALATDYLSDTVGGYIYCAFISHSPSLCACVIRMHVCVCVRVCMWGVCTCVWCAHVCMCLYVCVLVCV